MVRPFLEQISWHPSFFLTTYSLSQLLPPPGADAQTCVTARAARASDLSSMAAVSRMNESVASTGGDDCAGPETETNVYVPVGSAERKNVDQTVYREVNKPNQG
jgi:hypothetical protein